MTIIMPSCQKDNALLHESCVPSLLLALNNIPKDDLAPHTVLFCPQEESGDLWHLWALRELGIGAQEVVITKPPSNHDAPVNMVFWQAIQAAETYRGPYLWCEPDVVFWRNPLELEKVLKEAGTKILGALTQFPNIGLHVNGVALYRKEMARDLAQRLRSRVSADDPFDLACRDQILPATMGTNQIMQWDKTTNVTDKEFQEVVDGNPVLVHGCKDATLYKRVGEYLRRWREALVPVERDPQEIDGRKIWDKVVNGNFDAGLLKPWLEAVRSVKVDGDKLAITYHPENRHMCDQVSRESVKKRIYEYLKSIGHDLEPVISVN